MLEICKQLLANQYEAALCMLGACVDRCPEENWHGPVVNMAFDQAVFHTLIHTDAYLGHDRPSVREQEFHRRHAEVFADYEEFENRPPVARYEKPFIEAYLQHCRDKAARTIASETAESLAARPGFPGKDFSRAELHVYNIRHVHHHAAQLSLRLRQDTGEGIPWVGSGWREV